ncbi:MAG: carbamoyl-phosphate synthase large subunit, partial [Kineosporiaceae bacterium]
HGLRPVFKTVDTCAAEFAARTPYHYSSYDEEDEVAVTGRRKVLILGSGPNRIGQGIEFDYSCVHAAFALADAGFETVMVNCNPETVSTDYDTADRLYFEPLTVEDVLEVVAAERRSGEVVGVVVQLGGQTPLGLAAELAAAGVPVLGTSPEAIRLAEDRAAFGGVLDAAGLRAPTWDTADSLTAAPAVAAAVGYPVLVRPSFVLGGQGMRIIDDPVAMADYLHLAAAAGVEVSPARPLLVDRFLDDAVEIDVDALCDGEEIYVGGVMEHVEEAGVHSGDSSCALPSLTLGRPVLDAVRAATEGIAHGVGVRGLLNVQLALSGSALYVLEANPRASRTVPFVSKATATPLAKAAARIMAGATIADLRREGMLPPVGDGLSHPPDTVSVKEAVLPFRRFRTGDGRVVDTVLGPEMRSTGEVMGIDADFPRAFAKSQAAASAALPRSGTVFVSTADRDKRAMIGHVAWLAARGFRVLATEGTAAALHRYGIAVTTVRKLSEGPDPDGGPSVVDLIHDRAIALIVNTPSGRAARADGYDIRAAAAASGTPLVTTVAQLAAAVVAIEAVGGDGFTVRSLQDHGAGLRGGR